ncbi:MAG: hypothetical protein IT380_28850 [Myxococcales bacterium]|nr:hypothetical protein [Myxococcales bacterium]
MKVLCPHCERLVELERFRVEGGVLRVTCSRCGAESQAPGARDAGASTAGPASSPSPEATSGGPAELRAPPVSAPLPSSAPTASPGAATARAHEAAPRPPSQPPRVSLASSPGASNVVMLRTATVDAIERAAQSADGDPFAVPEGHCPKCLARRDGSATCPQCGVQFDAFLEANVAPPVWLRDAWLALLRDWGDEVAHEGLRRRAQREEALVALGRLYRLRLAVEPNDPIAEKGRADVLRLASAAMSFRPSEEAQGPGRAKTVVGVVVLVFTLGAMGLLLRYILQQVP